MAGNVHAVATLRRHRQMLRERALFAAEAEFTVERLSSAYPRGPAPLAAF
jgi:hypothetical protein